MFRWFVRPVEQPDLILAALIGDYIHDLRSALDHLAFELSFRDSGGVIPTLLLVEPTDAGYGFGVTIEVAPHRVVKSFEVLLSAHDLRHAPGERMVAREK